MSAKGVVPLTRTERRFSVVIDHETGQTEITLRGDKVRLSSDGRRVLNRTRVAEQTWAGLSLTDLAALSEEITGALVYMTRAAVAVKADPDEVVR